MKKISIVIFFFFFIFNKLYSEDIMIMELKDGNVELELYSDIAPNHVKRFKDLAAKGLYDGVVFQELLTVLWHKAEM